MNKIIQDIAEHCDFYVGNEHSDKLYEQKQRLFMEKFAELIAQECMKICEERRVVYFGQRLASDVFIDKNMYAEGEAACEAIRYNIKRHFGVEE